MFWTREQTEVKLNTEMAQNIDKALAHMEKLSTRVGEFEVAFWSREEKDNKRFAESEQATAQKIRTMEDQLAEARSEIVDATRELIAVRHELENARDADERFRILEQGLAARQLALVKSQRGQKGNPGKPGPKGDKGEPGKDGITRTQTTVLKTKKWEINVEQSLAREILSDGSRMPALNLRPMFESLAHDLDQRERP